MSEHENIEMTAADEAELQDLLGEKPPTPRTLLETWREVLTSIESVKAQRVEPGLANRIVSVWPKLSYQDTVRYHEIYHDLLLEMRAILETEISVDPDCLKNVDDDAVENRARYVNLLLCWQVQAMRWEHEWDAADPESHIRLAAIGDAHAFMLSQNGLIAHLEQIGFQFTDADREAMAVQLDEIKQAL